MSDARQGKITEFTPDSRNANKGTQRGMGLLNNSLRKHGAGRSILIDRNGRIIAGNKTQLQAVDIGLEDVIIVPTDGTKLVAVQRTDLDLETDPAARELAYADNRVGELDLSWDVGQLLADIEAGVKLDDLFNQDELGVLLEEAGSELLRGAGSEPAETQPLTDKAEELQQKWQVKPGDVWALGEKHRLICGDCREPETWERLLRGQKVNSVFTSPPYAEQRKQQYGGVPVAEYVGWWEAVQANVRENLAGGGSFFVNIKPHCEEGQRVLYVFDLVLAMVRKWGWQFVDELCWTRNGYPGGWNNRFKNNFEPVYHFCHQDVIKFCPGNVSERRYQNTHYFGNTKNGSGLGGNVPEGLFGVRPSNVINIETGEVNVGTQSHGATFPVALPTFFIKAFSDPDDLWLDPFAGSGTSIIAAHNEGRIGYGIEKLEKYVSVVLERFLVHTNQQPTRLTG